ncbi:MAG: DUF4384 domain-containing protein [Deinococcales bacterium]
MLRLWLSALVFSFLMSGSALAQQMQVFVQLEPLAYPPSLNNLSVDVYLDRDSSGESIPVYTPGESLRIYARPSESSYLYIFNINSRGEVAQIFPNNYDQDNFISAQQVLTLPRGAYQLSVGGPGGLDYVVAIASRRKLDGRRISFSEMNFQAGSYASASYWASDALRFQIVASANYGPTMTPGHNSGITDLHSPLASPLQAVVSDLTSSQSYYSTPSPHTQDLNPQRSLDQNLNQMTPQQGIPSPGSVNEQSLNPQSQAQPATPQPAASSQTAQTSPSTSSSNNSNTNYSVNVAPNPAAVTAPAVSSQAPSQSQAQNSSTSSPITSPSHLTGVVGQQVNPSSTTAPSNPTPSTAIPSATSAPTSSATASSNPATGPTPVPSPTVTPTPTATVPITPATTPATTPSVTVSPNNAASTSTNSATSTTQPPSSYLPSRQVQSPASSSASTALGDGKSADKTPLEKWQAAKLSNYSFIFQQNCYCSEEYLEKMYVIVRNGKVSIVTYADSSQPVPDYVFQSVLSLGNLMDSAADVQQKGVGHVEGEFDRDYGFPKSLFIDYNASQNGDEVAYVISFFRVE